MSENAIEKPAETKPAKPGWKTSEGWLTFAAVLLSQFYALGFVGDSSTAGKVAAFIASALTAIGYTVARTKAKA